MENMITEKKKQPQNPRTLSPKNEGYIYLHVVVPHEHVFNSELTS